VFVQDRSVRRVRTKGHGKCLDLRQMGSRVALFLGLFVVSVYQRECLGWISDGFCIASCTWF